MPAANGTVLILAYLLGLLCTGLPGQLGILPGLGLFGLGGGLAIVIPRFWRTGPRAPVWWVAGAIACFATFYFHLRTPQPTANDISYLVNNANDSGSYLRVSVSGSVDSDPRLNRNQRVQFWLRAEQVREQGKPEETVSGRVYVTVPLLQGTGLYSGQPIEVTGVLYLPQEPVNPGGFNFKTYLARQGGFAGLSGRWIKTLESTFEPKTSQYSAQSRKSSKSRKSLSFWSGQLRRRVVKAHVGALGSPGGALISAMVMGSRVVDLPYELRDQFARIGLAHTIAASGFHVSLVLGSVLFLVKGRSSRTQFFLGTGALLGFISLTGFYPSILRATLMGMGSLVALVWERKVKPLGTLLLAALVLLIWNPLWIWDLGFQLSFLATFGLLTTTPALLQRLDWLPPTIASVVAVPLAASVWTMPVQLYAFGMFSPYSILVNVLTTPLIMVISLGGIISGVAGILWPEAGMLLAGLLYLPVQGLLSLVNFCGGLWGAAIAVGKASGVQLTILYSLMLLVWLRPQFSQRWWAIALLMLGIIFIPPAWVQAQLVRFMVIADTKMPTMIVQNRGSVGLVNSGGLDSVRYTILPFLRHQGVNRIDWALNTENSEESLQGWLQLLQQLPIRAFYDAGILAHAPTESSQNPDNYSAPNLNNPAENASGNDRQQVWTQGAIESALTQSQGQYYRIEATQTLDLPRDQLRILTEDLSIWHYQGQRVNWIWSFQKNSPEPQDWFSQVAGSSKPLLWWFGNWLDLQAIATLQPEGVIGSRRSLPPELLQTLQEQSIPIYWTGRYGALQWQPGQGIQSVVDLQEDSGGL